MAAFGRTALKTVLYFLSEGLPTHKSVSCTQMQADAGRHAGISSHKRTDDDMAMILSHSRQRPCSAGELLGDGKVKGSCQDRPS